jgi:Ca2+-dependent lipid-binding protein
MKRFFDEIAYDAKFLQGHKLQPAWWKVLKIFLLLGLIAAFVWFFGWLRALVFAVVFILLMLAVHMMYRVNTRKYTRNWADFIVVVDGQKGEKQSIGLLYYSLILLNAAIAFLASRAAG